jgi:hypothetical protein
MEAKKNVPEKIAEEKNTAESDAKNTSRGPYLTSPLGANFDHRGEVVPQG